MTARLQREIQKKQPFHSLEQEAALNVARTADALLRPVEEVLKPAGLSATQYNVLRILRGAGGDGLACREIGDRMISRDPDMTRLLDRLEARGLITRARETRDRRVIRTRITDAGLELLRGLDEPILAAHRGQLGHLGQAKLKQLIELLEEARATPVRSGES